MKYIQVQLTEDQAVAVCNLILEQFDIGNEQISFLLRIEQKIQTKLAKAKTV